MTPVDHLPPVEPPSAGFIVQLFLIPALIVAAIVGVWALFGKLASNEQDVSRVLADIRSSNANRRGPAMHTFTRMLQVDSRRDADKQQYVNNPSVASSTADILQFWLENVPSQRAGKIDTLNTQIFLTRALGWFDVPDKVLPTLRKALHVEPEPYSGDQTEQEIRNLQQQVRTSAVESIAIIAHRASTRGEPIQEPGLIDELIDVTNSPDAETELRHRGAFALGLLPSEQSRQQLSAWLKNADDKTRLNAAIALARQNSTEGYDVFVSVLREAVTPIPSPKQEKLTPSQRKRAITLEKFERWAAVRNVLEAVLLLSGRFQEDQRAELIRLIEPIERDYQYPDVRMAAEAVLKSLESR
ncbi:MAG: HEAT repeat domain-containing protein [Planctomycetes bacterium]|nr:HEAT repeat domain-containing protein [Planctomycetota bacterium]